MSGILGVFSPSTALPDHTTLDEMCRGLSSRGADRAALWVREGAALAASRYDWEASAAFSGPVLVLEEDECVVAADATLYHRGDLLHRLRAAGTEVRGEAPSHLILAAYQTWGVECARWLEGEFAFVVWDRRERRVFCARDFSGRRPLYYAELGESLVVGSTLSSILAHPACPRELNLPVLAATTGILLSAAGTESCYRAIGVVPIAGDLVWSPGSRVGLGKHWEPTAAVGVAELSHERAAEELRSRLIDATRERLAQVGSAEPTSIWLSGGWDSTAVFGIGQEVLRMDGRERTALRPISMSYPPGDPGREDETIEEVAGFWRVPVHWVESEGVPLFDQSLAGAALRDEPLAHLFEQWNRAMAVGSRAVGARVALDGYGGDQLFQISDIFLADLVRGGRWLELAREWRLRRERGVGRRDLLRYVALPFVPDVVVDLRSALRGYGRGRRSHLERPFPTWLEPGFVRRYDLIERERAQLPVGRGHAAAEVEWYLTHTVPVHIAMILAGVALQEGVELRSPLFDRRVVELALARPRWERASGRETKYLLRRAVRGLLPDSVLAPRARRTGLAIGYARRKMNESYAAEFEAIFREPLILAELGIVSPGRLRQAVEEYLANGSGLVGMQLFFTLQTELWLRTRLRGEEEGSYLRVIPGRKAIQYSASAGAA